MEKVIEGETFVVEYDPDAGCVRMKGTMRLNGTAEYEPIMTLLLRSIEEHSHLTLDLRELEFLNSSGIATISRFVITARDRHTISLTILGTKTVAWQGKSLRNLQRLMPDLHLDIA